MFRIPSIAIKRREKREKRKKGDRHQFPVEIGVCPLFFSWCLSPFLLFSLSSAGLARQALLEQIREDNIRYIVLENQTDLASWPGRSTVRFRGIHRSASYTTFQVNIQ